jgi:phosphopantothenoylcysteine decarboxylase/phosphopantothenate--cysteine ligase
MGLFTNKKILLGITGSIAAYKSAFLVRLLIKEGAEVKVVMTPSSLSFISSLSLSTLSKNKVFYEISDGDAWNNHVELGLWADIMIIAPTSANTIGKMANGILDNMLLACYFSAKCPVFFAPAMDLDMWLHPANQSNINKLQQYGNIMIDPEDGELASGLIGTGRMAEPEHIIKELKNHFQKSQDLKGKKVLITAGPTHEHLDPVRFMGNNSSGKMGYALAIECANRGAEVTLVLGPTHLSLDNHSIKVIDVVSADEMYQQCLKIYKNQDIAIFTAAVADYTYKEKSETKIKKKENMLNLTLHKNVDIASELGKVKTKKQVNIGFALETNNEEVNAIDKLKRKNFNLIVLNSLNDKGAGFGHDTNKITIFSDKDSKGIPFKLKSKKEVATDIINQLVSYTLNK